MANLSSNVVILDYSFMFDPEQTWNNFYAFETDLVKFFEEHGLEATVLKSIEGQYGKRILYLSAKQGLEPLTAKDMPGKKGK